MCYTPDQPIDPPQDDKYQTCLVCNGKCKVIPKEWDYDEDGEPEEEDLEKCPHCKGEGVVEIEPWEDEW
jgi:DnaJ-class molecular chaperone